MATHDPSPVATCPDAMLPQHAVNTVLRNIAGDLMCARDLLSNAGEVTLEMVGAIAIIEKVGALAAEAVQAYGGSPLAPPREWLHAPAELDALFALAAVGQAGSGHR